MTGRRPGRAPRARMGDAEHAAITTELVRLSLGGRPARPELEVDVVDIAATARRPKSKRPRSRWTRVR